MRYTPLLPGGPEPSILGLGCAAMMGSAGRKQSLAALSAALDNGINFFDTARSYGYGQSESLLGEFLAGRRHQAVLCTKFGILPAARSWKTAILPAARAALRLFPSLRSAARRQAGHMFTENQFSVPLLRSSFETSLRELRTDYVDILLLHAAPPSVLAHDDLLAELQRLVDQGKVRFAGISGELDTIERTFALRPPVLRTAQFACNLTRFAFLESLAARTSAPVPSSNAAPMFLVANHPFGGPTGVAETRARIAALAADPTLDPALREKLQPSPSGAPDPGLLPDLVLNCILTGTGIGAVIPAMLNPAHLRTNCRVVTQSRFTPPELAHLRKRLAAAATSPSISAPQP